VSVQPIRVGLIGFGLSGRIFHAPFLLDHPDFVLAGVCSSQADLVHQVAPGVPVLASSDELIKRVDLDLIVITAPNHLHFTLAQQALQAGKHVLLEKPAVTELAQMEALKMLAEQQGKLLTVYHNRRYDGDFLKLRELVLSGALGKLRHLDSRFDRFRPHPQARWREQPGVGTGIFWDLGPHLLDQVLLLLGPPEQLSASLQTLRQSDQADAFSTDWFEVQLFYPERVVTVGSTPFEAGKMRRFNARFDAGSWQCMGVDPQEEALRAGQMPWHAGYPDLGASQNGLLFQPGSERTASVSACPVPGDYRHFYQQLAQAIQGKDEPPVTLQEACRLIYTLQLAECSAEQGRQLAWSYPD